MSVRHILAAVAVGLLILGATWISDLHWEGLIALFIGGCLWWAALHLSRAAWYAAREDGGGSK